MTQGKRYRPIDDKLEEAATASLSWLEQYGGRVTDGLKVREEAAYAVIANAELWRDTVALRLRLGGREEVAAALYRIRVVAEAVNRSCPETPVPLPASRLRSPSRDAPA